MELIKRYKVLAAILAVVVAVGVGCWVYQLIFGLTVTGMNNGTSWGLYITTSIFFVGVSAGGLLVASLASVLPYREVQGDGASRRRPFRGVHLRSGRVRAHRSLSAASSTLAS